jgi:hypothetical protein
MSSSWWRRWRRPARWCGASERCLDAGKEPPECGCLGIWHVGEERANALAEHRVG